MNKLLVIILSLALFTACEPKIDEFPSSANGLDFTNFVAVGNSMTAGYADGALYLSGQKNSISNIMATQFQTVGGGAFHQPLIGTEDGVGFQLTPAGLYFYSKMILKITPDKDCQGNPVGTASLKPGFAVTNPDQATLQAQLFAPPLETSPYNNMGVPGASLMHLFYNRLGDPTLDGHPFNPYFVRFASSINTTILQDAITQNPTFFYLWIGNNDALTSALAGTDALLTPADTFAKYYPMAAGALAASAAKPKGVLATIPDITSIPFFTTISKSLPYNSVILDATQAAGLNQLYTMYGHSEIIWKAGANPFVYAKEDGTWAQMEPGDLFLLTLPTDSIKCKGMGVADQSITPIPRPYPIPGKFILNNSEQVNIKARIAQYNQTIKGTAAALNLALADMNTYLQSFTTGMVFDGIKLSTTFVTGGLFSTDGVHLNPRGNAVAANYFIQSINAKYGCNIPQANITEYNGLIFP
ncbi:MAG: hypothetical protein WCP32_11750 [Bacteroidota bacterium]